MSVHIDAEIPDDAAEREVDALQFGEIGTRAKPDQNTSSPSN